jgi:phage shock protein E
MRSSLLTACLVSLFALAGCSASEDSAPPSTTGTTSPAPSGSAATGAPTVEPASACTTPAGQVVDVSVADLKALVDANAKIAVVDVREPSETAAGTIANALLYPWTSKVLEAKHDELPKDRPVYVICRSGNRSVPASAFLAKQGRACIHNVQGGMNAWTAAAYPTVTR